MKNLIIILSLTFQYETYIFCLQYSNIRQGIVEIKANVLEMRSLLTEITTSIRNSSSMCKSNMYC